ncbi:MAG: cyanophycin synthetase [Patescibacteria group bacterium]
MKVKTILSQPLLADLFKKIGKKLGVEVTVEKEYGVVGKISYSNGINRYFRGTTLDINTMGSSEIARDKDYSKIFMKEMGYPVIPWKKFYSTSWTIKIKSKQNINKAWQFAKKIGLPVFIKPNSKSQGIGVTKIYNRVDFFKVFKEISKIDNVILVEKPVTGKDYRLVVLDKEVISAYERIPLTVVGDGKSNIKVLLEGKHKEFQKNGRERTFKINDKRLKMTLSYEKLTFRSILPKGKSLKLLNNANLSTGGTSIDVTEMVHPFFKETAIGLSKDMGLRLCGVDLMIDGDISTLPTKKWYVIEINSAPGLDHYASLGRKQQEIVELLYTKVFKAMGKNN